MNTNDFRGPWKTSRMYTGQLYVSDKRGLSVCEVKDQFFQGEFKGDKEANARLISAAPDMLRALEHVLSDLNSELDHETALIIQSAIAKAKGE